MELLTSSIQDTEDALGEAAKTDLPQMEMVQVPEGKREGRAQVQQESTVACISDGRTHSSSGSSSMAAAGARLALQDHWRTSRVRVSASCLQLPSHSSSDGARRRAPTCLKCQGSLWEREEHAGQSRFYRVMKKESLFVCKRVLRLALWGLFAYQ